MIFLENLLPADDSHEISCLIFDIFKKQQNLKLSSAANYRLCFMGYVISAFTDRSASYSTEMLIQRRLLT